MRPGVSPDAGSSSDGCLGGSEVPESRSFGGLGNCWLEIAPVFGDDIGFRYLWDPWSPA